MQKLGRAKQTIYNVMNFLKEGKTIQEYYKRYKENKKHCGVKPKQLSGEE